MQFTIRPLLELHKDRSREYVKRGDLEQLVKKILRTKEQQLQQGKEVPPATSEYLKILQELITGLPPKEKLAKTELARRVDDYIRENELHYFTKMHPAKHENTFYAPNAPYEYQDLALYNSQSSARREGHHADGRNPSVCYVRMETRGTRVLIGNLQIDDRDTAAHPWSSPTHEKILHQRKNLYLNMVQAAIVTALEQGRTKIMFQGGAAAQVAQRRDAPELCTRVRMTGKYYQQYTQLYQALRKKFDEAGVGDSAIVDHFRQGGGVIIEKTPTTYQAHHNFFTPDGKTFFNLLEDHFNIYNFNGWSKHEKFETSEARVRSSFYADDMAATLKHIEQMFQAIDPDYIPDRPDEKLKYLRELVAPLDRHKIEYMANYSRLLDKFFIKFDYHKLYLQKNPNLRAVKLTPQLAQKYHKSALRFYDINDKEGIKTFRVKDLVEPQRGKTYVIPTAELGRPIIKNTGREFGAEGLFTFHEKTLPEIFTKLGLGYKAVKISTKVAAGKKTATAWLLTTGLDELQRTPRPSFATGPELKTDTATLPQLQAAAQKFGLAPHQLKITNDWLCAAGMNRLGQYDPATDHVTLSSPSLSLVAHEGLHRLVARGLVPPREYQSLITAGRSWARAHPAEAAGRLKPSKRQHPAPPEEYAALFVEKYYEHEKTARKYLQGVPVPVFARLVGYIKEVRDVVLAAGGHAPARARSFLRRIERNQVSVQTQRPAILKARGKPRPRRAGRKPAQLARA